MMFEFAEEIERLADIKVVGVGGAGGNAVGRMIEAGLTGVEFLAINTDLQALKESLAHNAMQIGAQLTKGLGSGGLPATGRAAAQEDNDTIASALQGADMVFVTAGMGGGTGTGAAPVIAEIARAQGALTVGIVTKPFLFEGKVRLQQAIDGIDRLREAVDTLIVIPNQRLLEVVPPNTSMQEAFRIADNVLYEATRGIYEIISRHDHVNLDFADVRSVMTGMGEAMMGTGRAEGSDRAIEAARAAISSPLLEDVDIAGSQAVLVNVLGREVGLQDTAAAMQFIQEAAGPQAHVIFGYGNDESLGETLQITVIATGFQANEQAAPEFSGARVVPESMVAGAELEDPIPETEDHPSAEVLPAQEPELEVEPVAEQGAEQYSEQDAEQAPDLEEDHSLEFAPEPGWDPSLDGFDPDLQEPLRVEEPVERSLEPTEAAELGFLTRAAAGGGPDVDIRPAAGATVGDSNIDPAPEPEYQQRFLRPAGRRLIGEVEVPEKFSDPEPVSRSTASGLGPDHLAGDLNTPAYTRKYMD